MKKLLFYFMVLIMTISCSEDEPIITYQLTTGASPSETGIISPESGSFVDGESITLKATPNEGYSFVEWTGSASGAENPIIIQMNSNKSIQAVFKVNDDDNDGVANDLDKCPDTPIGEDVNEDGCSASQKDSDNDGVMDDLDECPDTPEGDKVDEKGCSIKMTYVPDDAFEQYLIDSNLDDVLDDYVVTENISELTNLSLRSEWVKGIKDMTGIEDFVKLETLEVTSQELTTIDVSKNTALKKLDLWENQITSIDLSNNLDLEELILSSNQITSIDLSNNNNKLSELSIGKNKLNSIDVSHITGLISLALYDNEFNDIDISKNKSLTFLGMSRNNLSTIDLNENNLTELWITDNQLTSLDVSKSNNLSVLWTQDNQLSCIQVNSNQIGNAYEDSDWKKDPDTFYSTDCSDPNAGKTYVPDDNFEQALIDLGYDDKLDDYVSTAKISGVTFLSLSNKNISDLTGIEDFKGLIQLYAQSNSLTTLDFTNNTSLETLILDENNLTSIDISTLNKLFALTVSYNNLTTINTLKNPNLYTLSCSSNKITSFDLSQNSNLDTFFCDNNSLTSLDISNNSNLNDSTGQNQFKSQNNQLSCIKVSQSQLNNIPANWTKDSSASYSTDCN